jgi:hypothetical protein
LAHQLAGPAHADDVQQEAFARAAHRPPGRTDNRKSVAVHARTDADGWARFEGLPPGPVLVWFADDWSRYGHEASVTRRGPPPVEHVVTVRPGQTHTIELALPR